MQTGNCILKSTWDDADPRWSEWLHWGDAWGARHNGGPPDCLGVWPSAILPVILLCRPSLPAFISFGLAGTHSLVTVFRKALVTRLGWSSEMCNANRWLGAHLHFSPWCLTTTSPALKSTGADQSGKSADGHRGALVGWGGDVPFEVCSSNRPGARGHHDRFRHLLHDLNTQPIVEEVLSGSSLCAGSWETH